MPIRFMQRILGVATDVAAAVVGGAGSANTLVATNASGVIDASFLPAGTGDDLVTAPASEALSGPALVNIFTNTGAANVRNADNATAAAGKAVSGFVLSSVASGGAATVYSHGLMTGLTGLTPGALYYLGTAGGVTATPPSAAGTTVQVVGYAVSATAIDVQPLSPIAIQ